MPEHLGHHPRSRGDLSAHGGRGGGGGRGLGQYLRRGSTLVRTVRTLKRRNKGRGSGVGSPTAAAAADKGEAAAGEQAPLLGSALSAPASITPGEDVGGPGFSLAGRPHVAQRLQPAVGATSQAAPSTRLHTNKCCASQLQPNRQTT